MRRTFGPAGRRRGVILMVVLALLTLFAVVGITFVLYATAEATAARVAREAEGPTRADLDPELALSLFLTQLIFDTTDDIYGVGSGLRGHSLMRTQIGLSDFNGFIGNGFNGVGRLHYPGPAVLGPVDDYNLVNYTWFEADGFLRDPEHYGSRASPAARRFTPHVAGNPPYTYPDLNNFFLAAVKADGTVLIPSFHRPWLFNPGRPLNDMTNPTGPIGWASI
jgi:hypothetical protein